MPGIGVIDVLDRLPIGILTPRLDGNGPRGAGNWQVDTWDDAGTTRNVSDTFGCIVEINGAIAVELGRTPGFSDGGTVDLETYEDRICQFSVMHQMLGGAWIATQVADLYIAPTLFRWVEALPGRVGLYVDPTWSIDLYFLRAL
jgi:hypothetical protein